MLLSFGHSEDRLDPEHCPNRLKKKKIAEKKALALGIQETSSNHLKSKRKKLTNIPWVKAITALSEEPR